MIISSIYEDPQEYAKTCDCSLEVAEFRCNYYLNLQKKAGEVHCPSCNADSEHVNLDSADDCSGSFVSCDECGDAFDLDDIRFKAIVDLKSSFDDILYYGVNRDAIDEESWLSILENSTKDLQKEIEEAQKKEGVY